MIDRIGECFADARNILRDASIEQLAFAKEILELNTEIGLTKGKEIGLTGNDKRSHRETILSMERKKNRLQRAEILTAENCMIRNEELKKRAKEVLKSGGFDSVSADDLLSLEQLERGTLSKVFAYKRSRDGEGYPIEEPLNLSKIAEEDEIIIDFGRNAAANARIGAADILPPSVRVVKIFDADMNVRVGVRQVIGGRAGYYDMNGKYIPVFTGHTIRIPSSAELAKPEYKDLGKQFNLQLNRSIETDVKVLETLNAEDAEAMKQFRKILEQSKKEDQVSSLYSMISTEAGASGTYKERLDRMIEVAGKYEKTSEGEQKELLTSLIARLTKTKEILGDRNVGIDIDRYKVAIARHESGGQGYFARNDDLGRKNKVRPGAWAFGKYQFTVETLQGFGVDLGIPPDETKIQSFLNNPALQEEIMDRYIIQNLERNILPNQAIAEEMTKSGTSLSYYLALTHIGGPGALSNKSGADWLGTSKHTYAMGVANAYERNLRMDDIQAAVPRIDALNGAKIDREALISAAERHLGKPYSYGANGNIAIDCSQLIVEALKENRVVHSRFDTTAAGFEMASRPKQVGAVERGDLVFLRK